MATTPPPVTKAILHYALVALAFVAALGPAVAHLSGVLPGSAFTDITSFVAGAGILNAWLTSSPLFQPLLQLKSPAAIIAAARIRQVAEAKPPVIPADFHDSDPPAPPRTAA